LLFKIKNKMVTEEQIIKEARKKLINRHREEYNAILKEVRRRVRIEGGISK